MARRVTRLMGGRPATVLVTAVVLATVGPLPAAPICAQEEEFAKQRIQYDDDAPKSILELQRARTQTRIHLQQAIGAPGTATLTNLNPETNTWYLLSLDWSARNVHSTYHLENPDRLGRELRLTSGDNRAVEIETANGSICRLWSGNSHDALADAAVSGLPYAPLCSGALYLRTTVAGHRTSLERVTDFLRDRLWGGDRIIEFVKREFYRDEFLEKGQPGTAAAGAQSATATGGPAAADIAPEMADLALTTEHLSLDLEAPDHQILPGRWYAVRGLAGVTVSALAPQDISRNILLGHERSVNPLGTTESEALVYLVAFDLQAFDLHFVVGTDHPRLDWSERPPPSSQDSDLPGPDGVANAAPLVTNGMISPVDAPHTVAAFAGGFKRSHGAFKTGPLALRNHGSHYGFVEQGVVFSKLQPGLATVFATNDGRVAVRTWTTEDDVLLPHVRYARQNGLPLIEYDSQRSRAVPGDFVNLWGPGNWSGSASEDLRTLRAGMCLQGNQQRRYLIYGYFSAATPSAMARVFQAYGCRYAMHLDMNALEHTYLALYVRQEHQMLVEHLVEGMQEVDRTSHGELAPRFLAFPDDRDFFYFTRRDSSR
jgi:hypothetical protein